MTEGVVAYTVTITLFLTGFAGLLLRRQLLAMLLSLELMTNSANILLVYQARQTGDAGGLAAVFLLLAVAACEAVVGLALILALYRSRDAMETGEMKELHG